MKEYSHLRADERRNIYKLHREKKGVNEIAREVGRSPSTISRELRKNCDELGYLPDTAQERYRKRRRYRKKKISNNPKLRDYVVEKMQAHWSPEQISGRMKLEANPFYASTETIYQFVYSDDGIDLLLHNYLRYRQSKRGQMYRRRHRSETIKDRVSIHQRPTDIVKRTIIGDFEGDLTFFSGSKSENLTILVDRKSRLITIIKNQSKQTSVVIGGIMKRHFDLSIKSITFDNGSEFAHHTMLKNELGIKTYFCDPGAPWQKGSVENSISRLHRYIPKNGSLKDWTDGEIVSVEIKLNNTPRKILGFLTPFEVFNRENQGVALHS